MEIREATSKDNDALLALCREAPMRGAVTAYVDRAPDFFALTALQGEAPRVWVAEERGRLLGCLAQAGRRARYGGREVSLVYGGDLKVHPDARGRGLALTLCEHLVTQARVAGADLAEGVIIHGNDAALGVAQAVGRDVRTEHAGRVTLYQVLPFRPYRPLRGYVVRPARPGDQPALLGLLQATYGDYACAPVMDAAWLEAELTRSDTFSLADVRVAEHHGRLVAAAAFWDQHRLRRTVVTKLSRSGQLLVPALRLARPLLGLPTIPGPGDALRYEFLRFPAARPGHVRGLEAILRVELEQLRRRGRHHFLWCSFHQADPLQDALRGLWKIAMHVHLWHFAFRPEVPLRRGATAARAPAYVDFSVV